MKKANKPRVVIFYHVLVQIADDVARQIKMQVRMRKNTRKMRREESERVRSYTHSCER